MQYIANIQPNIAASTPVSKNNAVDALLDSQVTNKDEVKFSQYLAEGEKQDASKKPSTKSISDSQDKPEQLAGNKASQQPASTADNSATSGKEKSEQVESTTVTENSAKPSDKNAEVNTSTKASNNLTSGDKTLVDEAPTDTSNETSTFDLLSFLNQSSKAKSGLDKAASDKKFVQSGKDVEKAPKLGEAALKSADDSNKILVDGAQTPALKPINKLAKQILSTQADIPVEPEHKANLTKLSIDDEKKGASVKSAIADSNVRSSKNVDGESGKAQAASSKLSDTTIESSSKQVQPNALPAAENKVRKVTEGTSEGVDDKLEKRANPTGDDLTKVVQTGENKTKAISSKSAVAAKTTNIQNPAVEASAKSAISIEDTDKSDGQPNSSTGHEPNKELPAKNLGDKHLSDAKPVTESKQQIADSEIANEQAPENTQTLQTKVVATQVEEPKPNKLAKKVEDKPVSAEKLVEPIIKVAENPENKVLDTADFASGNSVDETSSSSISMPEQANKKESQVVKSSPTITTNKDKLTEQVIGKENKMAEEGHHTQDEAINKDAVAAQQFEVQAMAAQVQSQQTEERFKDQNKQQNVQQVTTKQEVQQAERTAKTQQQIVQLKEQVQLNKPEAATALNDAVRFMMNGRVQAAELRLDPPELGSMQIKISLNGDAASVSMLVQNPQAKEMLDQSVPKLREMLEQQGLELSDSQIEHQQANSGQGSDRNTQGGHGHADSDEMEYDEQTQVIEQKIHNGHIGEVDYYA